MQIVTKEMANTVMRWIIVMALFSGVIYQSTRLEVLKDQLNIKTAAYDSLHKDWLEAEQEYANAVQSCPQQ